MAGYYGSRVVYVSAAASVGTADLCVLTSPCFSIKVTNVAGTAPLYFTVDRPGGACVAPVIGGANDFAIAATAGNSVNVRHDGQFGSVVQVISSGTTSYTVEVQGAHATS